jgi:hypothetical protein
MDGLGLAKAGKDRRPELVIVVASGHLKLGATLPDGWMFFPKPYSRIEVASAIKTVVINARGYPSVRGA